mmetsp:Transcript_56/g.181  ORF Transcript_56/g.181 Transcript_56/m.181 type:complete len:82 (-) Transcript_56:3029-3274(-)
MQPGEKFQVMPLGAGSEVGRSCVIVTYKHKRVMFDCGIHPGLTGDDSLPYFDEIDLVSTWTSATKRMTFPQYSVFRRAQLM